MMSNKRLLDKAKKLKAALQKEYDKLAERAESTVDVDYRENISYAIGHMTEVIEALECNE